MSALDEMRKRVNQNKVKINEAETKTSNTLDEMRKRVEAKKQEIEAQNKKVQEYNDFLKTTDVSKIKPLQLPQDKLLNREYVAELAKKQTKEQAELDYYMKNPATFGSNLKRNLLQPTKQTLKNFSTAALSTGANTIEYFQDNNAFSSWNDEKKAMMKALNEQFNLPKEERTLNIKKTDTYNKILEEEAQKRYENTDALTQRLRDMRAKTIQETQNMEDGLGKSVAEASIVVGDMLPAIGVGVLTGGVGSSLAIYGNAAQNAYQTAIENGATHEQASNNATLNGLLEATIELIGGKALGKLTKLPTLSSKVGGKILAKMPNGIKTILNNTFIRGGLEVASDVLEEGFEEVVSGFIQPFIDRVTYNPDAPLASFKSQWEAFSSSILPTLMFAGINIGSNRVITSLDKQMAMKSVNAQIDNLANKQIEQIENTDLPMLERVEMINEVKKQQVETKTKFSEEINKFEVVETNPDTNLKTTPQNNTNFAKTAPINEDISQNNVQNVSNLPKTVQDNSTIQGLEDYTEQDIKDLVSDYIEDITNEKISDIALINEDGNIKAKVYYNGNLNEIEPLEVEGKQIKIEQQMYEESDVFEERAGYNVDINEENEYNTRKREVARKPEARNYTYKKIESRDRARVNSDYMANEIKYADDVGVVNFDDVSYAYEKTNEGINVLLKFKGSQNYIKGVTEYVRGSSNTRPKGYNRYVEIARSRYADNNISDADGRRTRTSEESNIETDRTRRQGRKDDIAENVKNNGNNLENSEEQGSFSMDETDNIRYDVIPTLKNGFYSQLENVIINKMQRQAKAEDVMNLIRKNGVKQDEIDWTGIDDFLANKETVTKDEVIEYISANQIEIEEVVKDDGQKARYEQMEDEIRKEMDDLYYEAFKIMEKYNIHMRVGDPFDTMDVFWAEHGKDEIYNLVDLESFAKKADGEYYLDGETGEIFTLDEMHREIDSLYDLYNQRRDLEEKLEEIPETSYGYADDFEDATKFKRFATKFSDMGENYREILFRLPNAKGAKPYYKREHWDDISNIFAHTRLQDYKDKNGNNVLFIEEIQSDMHQEGRKQGYARNLGKINENLESVEKERAKLRRTLVGEQYQNIVKINERQKEIDDEMGKIIHKYFSPAIDVHDVIETFYDIIVTLELKTDEQSNTKSYSGRTKIDLKYLQDKDIEPLKGLIHLSQEDLKQYVLLHNEMYANSRKAQRINKETTEILDNNEELKKLDSQIKELEKEKRSNYGKIDALFPFKKNWHEFVLRKIINEAVKQGYDKVAWTTGVQQNDRYNLAKYINEIRYSENEDGSYSITTIDKDRHEKFFRAQTENELEELVGKEIAKQITNGQHDVKGIVPGVKEGIRNGIIENVDLEVGGEGMKGFYDKIIPEYLSKYLKKWNSKLEEVIIPDSQGNNHVQLGFTITPEMINSIKKTGQPLYDKQIDDLTRDNIIQKIVDILNVDIKSNKATLKQVASEIKTLIKGNQFTIDNIDRIISELGNKLKAVNAPEQKGQRRRSLATYWVEELGYDSWHEVAEELKAQLIELRNNYGELETDKKAIAASPEIRDVLKQAGFTEFEIYDPANAYIQNILEILEKDKDYYAKTLKQIEQETFVTGEKRMNTILNKRRHDVQSGKTPANPNYLKGASLTSMRKEVEKYLGKKVGLKGFRKRAYGIYKMNLDTIRVKDILNMETTIHELGHRINFKELDENLEGASRKELNALAERAFLNMYDDEPNVKLQEGWAEFTKRFVVDNQTTLKEYPELSNYMLEQLSNNPRVEKVITALIDMAEQYVNAPVETQIRKMQSIGEDTGKQEGRSFFDKYMYEVHDDLWDIKQMTRGFAKSMGTNIWKLSPSDNVYNLMRALRANEDRVLNVMKFGLIDESGIRRTKGMAEIMERLNNDPEKAQRVRDLLIAMRTLDYASVSLETGLAPEEALSLIAKYSKDTDVMNAANDIINFQEEIMKYAVSKGLMKAEDYQEMKKWNKLYIPLKRVFEGKNTSSNSKVGASNLTKRRTGSSREIIDPFESIIQNTAMILTKINQNEIIKTLADLQQRTGLADYFEEVDPGQRLKAEVSLEMFQGVLEAEGVDTDEINLDVVKRIFSPVMNDDKTMTIGYMDGGKLKAIEFKDKNIYDVITGADNGLISKTNLVLNTLDKFTGLLRLGATTGNLEFALPNLISDTMTAWLFSESGFVPAVDTIRGLVDYMVANYDWAGKLVKSGKYKENNKYMYDLYKQSGATMATRVASYRPEVQEYVLEVFGKHVNDLMSDEPSKMKKAGKAILKGLLKAPQGLQDVLSIIPEISEQATRFETFKKDYNYFKKKGYSHKNALLQATVNTRDITMDFNRMGHSMRAYNRIKAFSAARAQGIYRFVEGVEKMPKKVLSKVGLLTAISLSILAAANASGNDKEKEITDQKRKDNFIIPLGANGDIVTIKKPQGTVRSILNLAELIYNVGVGKIKEENYNQAWLNWVRDTVEENSPIELDLKEGNDFFSVISSAALPTALEPIIENALNRDFYYGNPIIPYGKEDLRPEDQYDENTSQAAILIGKAFKQSPAKIENLITGWFAGVGQQLLDMSDWILGKTFDDIPEAPSKAKDEAFITKRFFVSGYKNSESVSQIYDMINKLEDLKEYNEATEEQLEQLKQLNTATDTMSRLNKEMKAVRNNLSLSAKEKQKEILRLQELRTDTARYYLGKALIKNANKRQIELYEYYPSSTEYTYTPKKGMKVKVQYTESDQKRYAEIWKETYEEELLKFETSKKYYTLTDEEREKEIESIRTKARNKAQDEVSKEVYVREH